MSLIISSQIQLWRQKVYDGTITQDEMREAIAAIRKDRVLSSEKSTTSRAKKADAKKPIDSDELLSELM